MLQEEENRRMGMGPFPALGIHSAGAVPIHPSIHPSVHPSTLFARSFRCSVLFPLRSSFFESISSHPLQIPFPRQFTGRGRGRGFGFGGGGNSAPPSFPSWTGVMVMVQGEECTKDGGEGGRKGERNADNIHDF